MVASCFLFDVLTESGLMLRLPVPILMMVSCSNSDSAMLTFTFLKVFCVISLNEDGEYSYQYNGYDVDYFVTLVNAPRKRG